MRVGLKALTPFTSSADRGRLPLSPCDFRILCHQWPRTRFDDPFGDLAARVSSQVALSNRLLAANRLVEDSLVASVLQYPLHLRETQLVTPVSVTKTVSLEPTLPLTTQ